MKIEEAIANLNAAAHAGADKETLHPLVDELCQLILGVGSISQAELSTLDRTVRIPLLEYSWWTAGQAITCKSTDLVLKGLVAVVLEGGLIDLRDDIMRLAVLFNSARMLGMNAVRVFDEIAQLSPNANLAQEIRAFPMRPTKSRDLPSFNVRIENHDGVLSYRFTAATQRHFMRKLWPFS